MKRKLLAAVLAGVLIASMGTLWIMTRDHSIRLVEMEYNEFKTLAEQHLIGRSPEEGYSPPLTELFREMQQNPSGWSLLVRKLVADPTVPIQVKHGASMALLGLPPDQVAEFLEFLLTLAYTDAEYMDIAMYVAFNIYRGGLFTTPDMLPKGDIFDHSHRPVVRRVLQRMWEHPEFPQETREGDNNLTDLFRDR